MTGSSIGRPRYRFLWSFEGKQFGFRPLGVRDDLQYDDQRAAGAVFSALSTGGHRFGRQMAAQPCCQRPGPRAAPREREVGWQIVGRPV